MVETVRSIVDILFGPEPLIAIQDLFGPGSLEAFQIITELGAPEAVVVVVGLLLWMRGRPLAYGLLGAVILSAITYTLMKEIIALQRPDDPRIIVPDPATRPSFPSGHSALAATLWGGLAIFGQLPAVIAAIIIAAVMASRMYLGVHFLGDVIAGALLGLLLAWLYHRAWPAVLTWLRVRPFSFFLAIGLVAPLLILPAAGRFPLGWELFGATLGAAVGELLEYRYVRFKPGRATRRQQFLRATIGLGGLVVILGPNIILSVERPALDALMLALGSLWAVLAAPALFTSLGLAGRLD